MERDWGSWLGEGRGEGGREGELKWAGEGGNGGRGERGRGGWLGVLSHGDWAVRSAWKNWDGGM